MHDKGVNVCVMSENIPELLLEGYKTKQDINWQCDLNNTTLSAAELDGHTFGNLASIPSPISKNNLISFECADEKSNLNQQLEIDKGRIGVTGIKRCRDESSCSEEDLENNSSVEMSLKIQSRSSEKFCYSDSFQNKKLNYGFGSSHNNCESTHGRDASTVRSFLSGLNVTPNTSSSCSSFASFICSNSMESTKSVVEDCFCLNDSCSVEMRMRKTCPGNENLLSEFFGGNQNPAEINEECDCIKFPSKDSPMIKTDTVEAQIHPGLRLSLFPNVPPFIKFFSYDNKGEQFPPRIHKLLRWKLSKITPVVVRKVVANSGFRLLKKSTYWGGTWGKHTRSVGFKTLFDYQKINHFPGTFQIGRKDRLWKSLQMFMSKFGKQKFDLMPTTYVLPQDKKLLRMMWKKNSSRDPWIIKPPASARGTGIKVIHKWGQIPENVPVIVQKYISNPFLINETKFDLRLYVLVTSINPMRIYLYDNGLVRFASVKYSTEPNTLSDRYMHLTNYSINKLSSKYEQNEDAHACQGHKWTLKSLWNYMDKELKIDVKNLWQRLIDLIIKTIISGEHTINQLSEANLGSRYNSYELFGIDVLFDTDLKPWLLEVNISPSLHSASPLDLAVKAPMVHDLMNIVGFQIPLSKKFSQEQLCEELGPVPSNCLCFDDRLYTTAMSISEKYKHHSFTDSIRSDYLRKIIEDLTPDDVRHLIQYEDELTQLGSFQKIFPTANTYEYLQYFEGPRYYNFLFDAWETKYSENREEGIKLLRKKCEEGIHLQIPKTSTTSSKICEIPPKCTQCRQRILNNAPIEMSQCNHKCYSASTGQYKKASFSVNSRYRLRHSISSQTKTYLLRSRKHK